MDLGGYSLNVVLTMLNHAPIDPQLVSYIHCDTSCNRACDKMEKTAAKAWSLVSQAARYALAEGKGRDVVRANLRSSIYVLSLLGFIIWLIVDVTFSRGDTFFSTSVRDAWITESHLDADRNDSCIRTGKCPEVWRCACQQDERAGILVITYNFNCQEWLNNNGADWLTRYNSSGGELCALASNGFDSCTFQESPNLLYVDQFQTALYAAFTREDDQT